MANWSPLRDILASVDDRATVDWNELDALVGGLPRSARDHTAYWKGDRSGWPGFATVDVRVGKSVTFVRRQAASAGAGSEPGLAQARPAMAASGTDLVLVGCVKRKLDHPAPAQDLYTSVLFRKERDYAERSGLPWYILSAEHGLVAPARVLTPYDLRLSETPREYRCQWGRRVLSQLHEAEGSVAGKVIEIHAGAAYVGAVRDLLEADGVIVLDPLHRLTMGQRLAWYGSMSRPDRQPSPAADGTPSIGELVDQLSTDVHALTPTELLATGGRHLKSPGLYSWWVDAAGADELSAGLGYPVSSGLIYAGLAGATRSRSSRKSMNTLWVRIKGMHLGGRHEFSTFRLSVGSVLAQARRETVIDERRLTSWMYEHLRVVAIPIADRDALEAQEREVLQQLDPPLNIDKVGRTPLRVRLTEVRREYK